MSPARHLVLVGMMGAGKTTVGRQVAARLQRPFFDSDEAIEARTGRTVAQIFATDGEPAFRALETEVLAEMLDDPEPAVIAAAGGVVLDAGNRERLRAPSVQVVWLRADPAELARRVAGSTHRPLIDHDPEATLVRLAAERDPLYREVAAMVVDVGGVAVSEVVEQVLCGVGVRS